MITEYTTISIVIKKEDVVRRLVINFSDFLAIKENVDMEYLFDKVSALYTITKAITEGNARQAFIEGHTCMILNPDQINVVEQFMDNLRKNTKSQNKIEIVIEGDGKRDVVPMDYIRF
jgi:hypothetical protein